VTKRSRLVHLQFQVPTAEAVKQLAAMRAPGTAYASLAKGKRGVLYQWTRPPTADDVSALADCL
jgi:hypothetical protein